MNRKPGFRRFVTVIRNFLFVTDSGSDWVWPENAPRGTLVRPVIDDFVSRR